MAYEVRVGPGLNGTRGFEYFQHKSQQMKQGDRLDLIPGLEICPEHHALNAYSDDEQQVIAWNAEQAFSRNEEDGQEEQPGKEARALPSG
jgi:hypothetical protein